MSIKKGFTLIELCVGVILTGISLSICLSFFSQMHRASFSFYNRQIKDLEYALQVMQIEQRLRSKCFLFYTDKEIQLQKENKIKAAYRCRF